MEEQIEIKITCDKCHAAYFLRQLAKKMEARVDESILIETEYGYAEVIQ